MSGSFGKAIGDQPLSRNTKAVISFDAYNNVAEKTNKAVAVIETARQAIALTIMMLNTNTLPDRVAYALAQFFRCKPSFQPALRTFIAGKLEIILNGINNDVRLKIGDLKDKTDNTPVSGGYVTVSNKINNKWYHTDPKDNGERYGAIHLSNDSITLRTFVHEASHKFAGTTDYFYLGVVTPITSPPAFDIEPLKAYDAHDDAQPSQNADSYAWLVTYVSGIYGL